MSNTEDQKESQNVYEIGYLVLPSVPEDRLSEVVTSIKNIIKSAGATELDSEDPFKLDLAYTMTKVVGASRYVVNDAYFGWLKFESDSTVAQEIKLALEKVDNILRFLLTKTERETVFTFAEARAKAERALAEKLALEESNNEEAEGASEVEGEESSKALEE